MSKRREMMSLTRTILFDGSSQMARDATLFDNARSLRGAPVILADSPCRGECHGWLQPLWSRIKKHGDRPDTHEGRVQSSAWLSLDDGHV